MIKQSIDSASLRKRNEGNLTIDKLSINSDIISYQVLLMHLIYCSKDSIISRIILDAYFFLIFYIILYDYEFCLFLQN